MSEKGNCLNRNKLCQRRHTNNFIVLCSLTYFISYLTRINYGAVIVEIVRTEGITKSAASLATTGSFITYGLGQIISGYLGDRMRPKYLILVGLLTTSLMNLLLPAMKTVAGMTFIWCINGFAQAMIWPPMVRIWTEILRKSDFPIANVRVSWGSALGTITVYLLAPICILYGSWRSLFTISAGCGLGMSFLWIWGMGRFERLAREQGSPEEEEAIPELGAPLPEPPHISRTLVLIMFSILAMGILRDGITTWMPAYLSETFHMDSFSSILMGVVLPVFSVVVLQGTMVLNTKRLPNELTCAGAMFAVGLVSAAILTGAFSSNAALAVILSAVICGSMHGVNLMLVGMVPMQFDKYRRVAFMSGLLNFFTYVGSAISTYAVAAFAQNAGWQATIAGWGLIALVGMVLCFAGRRRWQEFVSLPDVPGRTPQSLGSPQQDGKGLVR